MNKSGIALVGLTMLTLGGGCVAKQDTSDEFREAIPAKEDVALGVPGGGTAGSASSASVRGAGLHIEGAGQGSNAEWYSFTRGVTDGVDFGTAVILGGVLAIVHSPATTIDAAGKTATWGPGRGTALDPVVWRFVVHDIGNKEYDYELDGRPKASTNDADFKAVLRGHGYGKLRPEHRSGWFEVDNETLHGLDASKGTDGGTVRVDFDLRQFPATIKVALEPTARAEDLTIAVTHQKDGSGAVDISGKADIEAIKDGNPEDVVLHSRWDVTGAGRADVQLAGGDMPQTVQGSECWDATFARSYYTDSANYKPTVGSATSCAFPASSF